MGRWRTFLALRVVLLLEVVVADDCLLNGEEEHAWLIRITPMKKKEDSNDNPSSASAVGDDEGKLFRSNRGNDDILFDAAGIKQNIHYRYKRADAKPSEGTPTPAGGDAKTSEAPSGGTVGRSISPAAGEEKTAGPPQIQGGQGQRGQEEQGGQGGEPRPGESVMHGALISAAIVLTTTYNEYEWMFISPMQPGFLSLVGYNMGKKCMQEQWAREAQYHTYASENALNAGEFAIIHAQEPFKVEANPFIFGPSGIPPVADIILAYNTLVGSPEEKVMMHLFKDPHTKTDGSTYDVSMTSFKFIPWRVCQEMDSLMTAGGKGMSPRVTAETFFCSMGIPGILNETLGGVTSGYGSDWYQGSPVIFTREDQAKVPIGHYIYRVGKSGDPRIYATYTNRLAKWLRSPSIIGAQTPPSEEALQVTLGPGGFETNAREDGNGAGGGKALKGITNKQPAETNGGRHISMAKLWVSIFAPASAVYFTV